MSAASPESPRQERAFEVYYGLGFGRSYEAVARQLGVSASTIKLWGRTFNWQKRVRERDLNVARTVADRTIKGETETRDRQLQIVHMAMMHVAKAVADRKVKVTMSDLDRLIRLERLLSNEPDSRTEHVIGDLSGRTREELQAMLAKEIEMARKLGFASKDALKKKAGGSPGQDGGKPGEGNDA
jgi:transposase-like protein